MRSAAHRYDPRLRPVGHRQARTPLWIPLWLPALLVILGAPLVVLAVFPASGVPGRLSLPPAVHATPGVRPSVSEGVVAEPPVDQGDGQGTGQGQRGDDPASRSTPRDVPGQPPTAPAASSPAQAAPAPLLLPVPTSPPPMVVPSPTPSPTGPGCGRKPPHPTRSPKVPLVLSDRPNV
jgi:hypothetical protein